MPVIIYKTYGSVLFILFFCFGSYKCKRKEGDCMPIDAKEMIAEAAGKLLIEKKVKKLTLKNRISRFTENPCSALSSPSF